MQLLLKERRFLRWESKDTARAHLLWQNTAAKSEQTIANYGERDAQPGRPVVCTERKNYEDTHNMEPTPGDGGISEPL